MAPLVSNIDGSAVLLVIVLNVNNTGFGSSIQDSLRVHDLQTRQRKSLPTDFFKRMHY